MQPLPAPPSPELLAEFLLWCDVLTHQRPGGPPAWFEDGAERWFLALLEPNSQSPVTQALATRITG